ncbi:MAG: hypothetical protein OQK25_01225, partial [Gammaproteobacteria bacterium]|nr:hypothetical protein [Gammaproteobacteria bacterium]
IDLATLDLVIPPLILQPLVENAIYHGIEQIPEGGAITIQTKYGDKQFTINVSNPIPQGNAYHALRSSGHHMALENIGHRIEMLDSEHGAIEIMRSDGQFIVTLTIPTREAGNR